MLLETNFQDIPKAIQSPIQRQCCKKRICAVYCTELNYSQDEGDDLRSYSPQTQQVTLNIKRLESGMLI